ATSIFAPPGFAASDVSRPNGPVIVIGADAMTFDLIDPMIKAGKLPNIKRLIQKGASGVLKSEKPMRSPALWTTMATGQPRKVHKIYDFVTGSSYWPKREREKEQRLVTSDMRQSRAIWNFATSGGKRSLVVGWLNTWPAEELNGVMVAPYVALGERRQTSIKGKIYKNAKNQTYPPELFETLQDKIVRANSVSPKTVARILDVPPKGARIYKDIPKLKRYLYTARWSLAGTATNLELVKSLSKKTDYDLVMTYFDGTDTLAHRFWLMRQPLPTIRKRLSHFGIPPKYAEEMKRRFGMSVENFYVVIDEAIGDLWKEFGDDATIIVLSDHGFGDHTRPKYYSKDVPFDGEHKENGII
ncbi:alkaline phosphatase family protein, partial [Myxococcota bacterium]|nr:alkaline phosphatase family protein [Myxococcota bacterium]